MNRRTILRGTKAVISGSATLTLAGCLSDGETETPTATYPEVPSFDATHGGFYSDIDSVEKTVHEAINEFRSEEGRDSVEFNDDLARISRNHSRNMAKEHFFDHTDHKGRSPGMRADYFGYPDANITENLYRTQTPPEGYPPRVVGERAVSSWKDSSSHRMAMLWIGAVVVGVGAYVTEGGIIFITAMFANIDGKI
jgi:uncharacterized protein YkwD